MADSDMVERQGSIPQPHTEVRSHLAPRSLLSQSIEAQLLPEERFKDQVEGEVVDIKKVGEIIAALRKLPDHYEANLYDSRGNVTTVMVDPTSHELARITERNFINKTGAATQYTDDVAQAFKQAGYSPNLSEHLKSVWVRENKAFRPDIAGDISKDQINNHVPIPLGAGEWKLDTVEDANQQKHFIVSMGDTRFMISGPPYKKVSVTERNVQLVNDSTVELTGNLKLRKGETVFYILDPGGKEIASYSGASPIVDRSDPGTLYFVNTGKIYSLDLNGVPNRSSRPELEQQIKVVDPKELESDPNGNFLITRSGDNILSVVDKYSGEVVKEFNGVRGPIIVDEQGDILFIDTNNKLRQVQTNFQAIPAGGNERAQQRREETLREMQEKFSTLELGKVQKQKGEEISEEDVANTLRDTISKQVTEQITQTTDPTVLEDVQDRLQALKGDAAYQTPAYQAVIDEFVTQAREKLSGIRTVEFDGQLTAYQKALEAVKSVGDTIGLDEQFAKLLELRGKIDVTDPQKRREIEQRLTALKGRKDAINTQYQGELIEAANEILPQLEQLIRETGSTQELGFFSTSTQAQQFEMMLANIRDPQTRKELRERYMGARAEHRDQLEARTREMAEQDRQRWAEIVDEAREDLASLQEQIGQLADTREIDRFGRNPLVTAWRAKLFALPLELRDIEEKKLEIILGGKKKDMEHRQELGAVGETGELKFGNATFLVYREPPRIWQPRFVPIRGGMTGYADLIFEDTQGRVWRPDPEHPTVVIGDMNDEKTKDLIDRYRKEADEYFRGIKRRVPDFDEHWRITDFHMGKLEEIAEALNLQLVNHRGILILQGEAGTGKNVLGDMLANLSNREFIQIACNENSVKEDLTYEFYYDPEKGTYKLPSKLVEGVQTPGTIIFFDEINALKPGIAKMLNPLFDYHRRIFLPEGGKEREIITDPTVIFMGAMNPQNYGGVNRLSPEVKSRARVVDIDYPPFEEARGGGRPYYRSDEAEMLGAYMDTLGELTQKELKLCWDYVVNNYQTNGADAIMQGNPTIETDIRRLYDVIRVANRLRDMYEAYQTGDSNEPMDFPTSLREVTDIVMEMNHRQGVKPMIKRVIIPKIDDRRQKRLVEETIDALLPT